MSDIRIQSEHEESTTAKTTLGFWIYLMTDCILFASLFGAYAVLHGATAGGVSGRDIFEMPYVLVETLLLLASSFTCGLATLAAYRHDKSGALMWFGFTFVFGAAFLGMEIVEFATLVHEGHSWRSSAFLSSFFTLVGTHGLHITAGLVWLVVMMARIWRHGFSPSTLRRVTMFGLFWHFLDIVWIFIFTLVYLMGVV